MNFAPFFDGLVIAREEDFGDLHSAKVSRSGVLWKRKQVVIKRVLSQGFFFTEYIWDEAGEGVDENSGGKGAVGEDVVADGDFLMDEGLADAFVDAFVVAGDEDDVGFLGELLGDGGFEGNAIWAQVDDF